MRNKFIDAAVLAITILLSNQAFCLIEDEYDIKQATVGDILCGLKGGSDFGQIKLDGGDYEISLPECRHLLKLAKKCDGTLVSDFGIVVYVHAGAPSESHAFYRPKNVWCRQSLNKK